MKIIFIIGPTGVGKTQVGLSLSELLPCEFVSADSMQVYRGMDIITDKLPAKLRRKYPHYLVDIISPSEDYNVAKFCKSAKDVILKILKKKKNPVIIGGTGLYINSLIYGIFEAESKDSRIQLKLENEINELGLGAMYERLKSFDPAAALKINPSDKRRIIRALEVFYTTNKQISALQKERRGLADDYEIIIFGLNRERQDLYSRIDQRVDFMINAGLLDEVRRLLKKKLSRTAYMCIGVREIEGFLKGQYDFNEAVRLIKRNSRHFAKRQMTWFKKTEGIKWVDVKPDQEPAEIAKIIYKSLFDRPLPKHL